MKIVVMQAFGIEYSKLNWIDNKEGYFKSLTSLLFKLTKILL